MKNKIKKMLMVAAIICTPVMANHDDPNGSVGLLDTLAEELQIVVQNSYLSYSVKGIVSRYVEDVRRLRECVEYGPRPMFHNHLEEVGCSQACGINLRMVQTSFSSMARSLYDTQYDYPEVYNLYIQNQGALSSIQVIGGGPIGPGPIRPGPIGPIRPRPIGPIRPGPGIPPAQGLWQCTAVDNGWEEHFAGHQAYGNGVGEAQSQALYECQRSHGSCRIQRCQLVR